MEITNQADFTTPVQTISNSNVEVTKRRPAIKDITFYPDPTNRASTNPVRTPMPEIPESSESTDFNPEIIINLEENSLFQEGVILEDYHRSDKLFLQEP